MIRSISIRNYALIDALDLNMSSGLSVITGETGAGKSIIIDAISLLLGQRANKDNIRTGEKKMMVSALFDLEQDAPAAVKFRDAGIDVSEGIVLSREVDASGRNVCRANGSIVPLALLREAGQELIDIHSQHEHVSLFKEDNQRRLLDAYAGQNTAALLRKTNEQAGELKRLAGTIRKLVQEDRDIARQVGIDRFELNEIDAAELLPDEEERLEDEKKLLDHAEKLFENASGAKRLLSEEDDEDNMSAILTQYVKLEQHLQVIASIDKRFAPFAEAAAAGRTELESLSYELTDYLDTLDFEAGRLEEVDNRLAVITGLERKYGDDIPGVLAYAQKLRDRLEDTENTEEKLSALKKAYNTGRKAYNETAEALHRERIAAAAKLQTALEAELSELAMEKARFEVRVTQDKELISLHGQDDVKFYISVNPGNPVRELKKVASGGEMSRIMLSLKRIFGEKDNIGTMIFDEIDTGISGRTAQTVAEKIAAISASRQVLCITHLPQIAAMADTHYLVQKVSGEDNTQVSFEQLSKNDSAEELARMLGGAKVTSLTRSHAQEMLELSDKLKQSFNQERN